MRTRASSHGSSGSSGCATEALALKGRFGKQQLAAPGPLSVEQGVALIGEAAENVAKLVGKPVPDLRGARAWLERSPMHRLPLYATAAAVHAVLSPNEMFGLSGAELVRQLALREGERARTTSRALGLGDEGLAEDDPPAGPTL